MQGKILSFNPDKGWGFIASDEGGDNVMLHVRELADALDISFLRVGTRVEFDARQTPRGLRAGNVRVCQDQFAELPDSGFLDEVRSILRMAEERLVEAARRYGVAG